MIHISKVVKHVEGKVDVNLIKTAFGFTQLTDLLFLTGGFFSLTESVSKVFLDLACCRLFQEAVNFLFNVLEIFLLRLFLFVLDDGTLLLLSKHTFLNWL